MGSLPLPPDNSRVINPDTGRVDTYAGAITNTMGNEALFSGDTKTGGQGSLPKSFDQVNAEVYKSKTVDIVRGSGKIQYRWTLSEILNRNDIPYIQLTEHRNNESMVKRQTMFYAKGIFGEGSAANNAIANARNNSAAATVGMLDVYEEIWPDNPTGWTYKFPYFSKTQYELTTPEWQQVDGIGQALGEAAGGLGDTLANMGLAGAAKLVRGGAAAASAATAAAELGLKALYPVVGIADRPRIFTSHSNRDITIQFPLYNTVNSGDWANHRNFFYTFANQNLFAKRDFITGLPPVFYRVYVPGQYFSFASCVTNFGVENLGNTRLLPYGEGGSLQEFIVPDAYQISITLTEMTMPSMNQHQAVVNGDALNRVNVGVL